MKRIKAVSNSETAKHIDGTTLPGWMNNSIKAYGNAIVPEVARRIFECIDIIERGGATS